MRKIQRTQTIAGASALALTFAMVACTDGDSGGGGSVDGAVQVALVQAPASVSPAAVESPPAATTASIEAGGGTQTTLTNVTYGDAAAVYRKGRYAEAVELFGAFVESQPTSTSGHYMLGLSAWKSGDRALAERALSRAVELDSGNVKAQTNLSRVLLEQGRAQDALPHMERAAELAPESYEVWRVLGNVKSELGRSEEAIAAYRHALIRNERDAWSMNNYGLVLIQQGRYQEAVPPLARAVELVPGSPVFLNNLGVALERTGELAAARSVFTAAVEADSTFTKASISLERVRAQIGDEPLDEPELSTFATEFIAEMQRWRAARPEHDGC
jgi:Flp pilus assembly protein TadD